MSEDAELLSQYAKEHSEAAFAELIRRHVDLVYSAALRLMSGDVHRAQDVTQQVFAELARQATSLNKHPALAGWLYTTTRRMALRSNRTEQRRKAREQEAGTMNELLREPDSERNWHELRPALEDAMHELREKDRIAILLRFFQNKSLREVGAALGLNENAARMRVERSLDKLRSQLSRKGVTSTAAVLASLIATNAVASAPSAFVATLATSSLAATTPATAATFTVLKFMTATKLKAGIIGAIVIVGVITPFIIQQNAGSRLREENQSLRQRIAALESDKEKLSDRFAQARRQFALHLPAPPVQTPSAELDPLQSANLYERLKDGQPKLTSGQVEPYLKANGRNAASLLAAYRTTGNIELLEEAMQKFPDDPQVSFEAAFKRDMKPEERRQWLDSFKKSDPDNALGYYLSALDYFRSSQTDQAVQDLLAASSKSFQDYSAERYQDDTEAYLAAGYSTANAKTTAGMQLLLPQLAQVKELGLNMIELSKSYRQAGDNASAQAALQMTIDLAQRYVNPSPGEASVSQLVGIAVESIALRTLDLTSPYGDTGKTVKDRLDQLLQQRSAVEKRNRQAEAIFASMSDHDWINYRDRWMMFGEDNAVRWLVNKYGRK